MKTTRDLIQLAGGLHASPSPQADARILGAAEAALDRTFGLGPRPEPLWRIVINNPITKPALAAMILIGVLVLVLVLVRHPAGIPAQSNRPSAPTVVTNLPQEPNRATTTPFNQTEQLAKELALAEQRFSRKDVDGLVDLLETGLDQTKVKVAGYLADLGERQAVPALQRLAWAWTGDPKANPFAQAVARIKPSGLEPNNPLVGQAPAKAPVQPAARRLKIKVVDKATGEPLPGTQVEDGRYVCDANGCCQIDVGDATSWEVWVSAPGYIGTSIEFQLLTEEVLSQTHLLAMDTGTVIGGIVQDVNGMPVEGVIVRILLRPGHDGTTKPFVHVCFEQRTGTSGRWSCDTVPADLLAQVNAGGFDFVIEHADYVSPVACGIPDAYAVSALRDGTYLTTLYEGSTLRGRVINEKGWPMEGARVNSALTGPDGTFVIQHIDPNATKIDLRIDVDGYPPTVRQIDYRPDVPDAEIVLQPGWFLSGRVVDREGKPLADAEIHVVNGPWCHVRRSTDAEGRYFTGPLPVPIGIMNIQVSKAGFMQTFRIVEKPADGPMDFVLHRELHVSGQVLDAQTGRPLDQFRITACLTDPNDKVRWETHPGQAGRYKHTFIHFCETGYAIVIEADGYLPATSRVIEPNERDPVIDLALTVDPNSPADRGTGP